MSRVFTVEITFKFAAPIEADTVDDAIAQALEDDELHGFALTVAKPSAVVISEESHADN